MARVSLSLAVTLLWLAGMMFGQEPGNCTAKDSSTRSDCPRAVAFFQKLQAAADAGDKNAIASMVKFPLRTAQGGKRVVIRNRQQLLSRYSQVFNPAVLCAIKSAKDSDVWGNYQGFMIGGGVLWWDALIPASVKNDEADSGKFPFKIISINNENVMAPGCGEAK